MWRFTGGTIQVSRFVSIERLTARQNRRSPVRAWQGLWSETEGEVLNRQPAPGNEGAICLQAQLQCSPAFQGCRSWESDAGHLHADFHIVLLPMPKGIPSELCHWRDDPVISFESFDFDQLSVSAPAQSHTQSIKSQDRELAGICTLCRAAAIPSVWLVVN
jgi:hypothetical protein